MRVRQRYWRARAAVLEALPDVAAQARALTAYVAAASAGRLRPRRRRRPRGPRERPSPRPSVLIISYYASPYRSRYGTQRISKFMKYLSRNGWDVSLVTTQPATASEQDPHGEPLPDAVRVIRLPSIRPAALTGRALLVPDDYVGWVVPAVRAVLAEIARHRPAALLATAPPYSNLLVGAIVSRRTGIPLVSDFRDPWSRIDTGWVLHRPALRRLSAALERSVLRASARVIMADDLEHAADFFARPPGTGALVSITNGFDEEDFAGIEAADDRPRDRLTISLVGTLYDRDTLAPLVEAFRRWEKHRPDELRDVVIEYAGTSSPTFDECGWRPPYLRDRGYVSHPEAIALRLRSDLQLFLQPAHFKAHVMSGKLYEMLRTGVPILAVTNPHHGSARLIARAAAGWVVPVDDPEAIAAKLMELFRAWRQGGIKVVPREDVLRSYSREALSQRLATVLRDVTTAPRVKGPRRPRDW